MPSRTTTQQAWRDEHATSVFTRDGGTQDSELRSNAPEAIAQERAPKPGLGMRAHSHECPRAAQPPADRINPQHQCLEAAAQRAAINSVHLNFDRPDFDGDYNGRCRNAYKPFPHQKVSPWLTVPHETTAKISAGNPMRSQRQDARVSTGREFQSAIAPVRQVCGICVFRLTGSCMTEDTDWTADTDRGARDVISIRPAATPRADLQEKNPIGTHSENSCRRLACVAMLSRRPGFAGALDSRRPRRSTWRSFQGVQKSGVRVRAT